MEPAAGMDVVRVGQSYGARLAFYGGIDKDVLRRSKAEFVRDYRFYVDKAWEIMDREASASRPNR